MVRVLGIFNFDSFVKDSNFIPSVELTVCDRILKKSPFKHDAICPCHRRGLEASLYKMWLL